MKPDRIKLYFFEILLLTILLLALFVSKNFSRIILAIILTIFAIVIKKVIKKTKKVSSMYKKQVFWLMIGFSIIYVISLYLLGLYFGYYKSATTFGLNTIIKFIIPFVMMPNCLVSKISLILKGFMKYDV
jgi:H+/Cl- antiporter ClcA